MSNTAERQFSLDRVSRAEGDKEQHRIISRLTFFFPSFKFYKLSTWSRYCRGDVWGAADVCRRQGRFGAEHLS